MNEAIGWALFHFIWEGAAIALLLTIVLVAVRSARLRYAAACIAMLAMVVSFALTLAIKLPAGGSAAAVHVPAGVLPPPATDLATGGTAARPFEPYRWAVPLWLAGVALLSLHRVLAFASARRLRRAGVRMASPPWPERVHELACRLGIHRPVQLLESCLAEVPVAAGYLRPAVLLPIGMLAGMPAEQVEYILIHELAHIARRDYLVNVLQGVVESLLFYHPAVWWVSGVIRAEREHCCDDLVVSIAGDPRAYAATLVSLEQARSMEPALAATGGSLTKRVRRLLRQPAPQSIASPIAATAAALAVVGMALAASRPQPPAPQVAVPLPGRAAAQAETPHRPILVAQVEQKSGKLKNPAAVADPYRKWLTEDVAYIITDQERAAYKALTTNEEKEQFIEQFWARRDPTPGTVENEMKEEHYRRIAYVNEHFSSQTLAGWKTDRGRVYITYGPPDQIEDHSTSQGAAIPSQQWHYRWIEGVGQNVIVEFRDTNRTGDFPMTSDPHQEQLQGLVKPPKTIEAVPSGPPDIYVATNGGRVTVSVSGHAASISIPSDSQAWTSVQTRLTTAAGRLVSQTQDLRASVDPGRVATMVRSVSLVPGGYHLTVTYSNQESGASHHEDVDFWVK